MNEGFLERSLTVQAVSSWSRSFSKRLLAFYEGFSWAATHLLAYREGKDSTCDCQYHLACGPLLEISGSKTCQLPC
jgi:hypothetical protein